MFVSMRDVRAFVFLALPLSVSLSVSLPAYGKSRVSGWLYVSCGSGLRAYAWARSMRLETTTPEEEEEELAAAAAVVAVVLLLLVLLL